MNVDNYLTNTALRNPKIKYNLWDLRFVCVCIYAFSCYIMQMNAARNMRVVRSYVFIPTPEVDTVCFIGYGRPMK